MAVGRTGSGGRGGWLALALALFAVLLQVNAPVARAAAMADPLQAAFCHDSLSGGAPHSDRREPASHRDCDRCLGCCAVQAALAGGEPPALPLPPEAVSLAQRPEATHHPVRGPPAFRPRARAPPAFA